MKIGDHFTLAGRPTLIFRVVKTYGMGGSKKAAHRCVIGHTLDGKRSTAARVVDVVKA